MSSDARCGDERRLDPERPHRVCRHRPYRCDAAALTDAAQALADGGDPVDAREDDPVVAREVLRGGVESAGIVDRPDLDERHDRDICSEALERFGERLRLGPRDDDALALEGKGRHGVRPAGSDPGPRRWGQTLRL